MNTPRSRRLALTLSLTLSLTLVTPAALADPPTLLDRDVVAEATRLAVVRAGLEAGVTAPLASRARWSALLPEVSLRVMRSTGAALTQYAAASGDRQLLDDALVLDLRVRLALDRLVFDAREVTLLRHEQQRAERRLQLESAVLDALAAAEQHRAALARLPDGAAPDPSLAHAFARARARVEQLTGVALEHLLSRAAR